MTRATTWSNSDGLNVGFGTNIPHRAGSTQRNPSGEVAGGVKVASVWFDYKGMNASTTGGAVNVPVPAGARILNVRVLVGTAWTSTGTNTAEIGLTGGDVDLFMTTTVLTTANFSAGAVLNGDGVGLFGGTDTGASELYQFSAADTVDLLSGASDWTAGDAVLIVTYI